MANLTTCRLLAHPTFEMNSRHRFSESLNRAPALLPRLLMVCAFIGVGHAQRLPRATPPNVARGEQLWKSGCNSCHGNDGKGAPETLTEFKRPETFPDFTRCDQTTAEPDSAWKDVIVHGGSTRAFSRIMPSFGGALNSQEIDDLIAYMRSFCPNKHWPRGELNLPRALVTEKAFPEDEVVLSTLINATGAPGLTTHVIHEQRFGVKNQIEVDLPINYQDQNHSWNSGIGDITLGLKRVMYSNLRTGTIFALQGSVLPPTGSSKRGFGAGTTTFETFAAVDQLFPTNTWIQFQMGADLPRHTDIAPQSLFWNTALGQTFIADHGLGRQWSPMVEFVATRDLDTGASTDWDIVPQMQVTISPRQHVRFDVGVRTPMTNTAGRTPQVVFYLLWDWADGKLWKGW